MPTVLVPTAYRAPTKGLGSIEVTAQTIRACIEAVEADHPGFLELVLDENGAVHRFVKIFLNKEQIDPGTLDQTVAASDEIEVLAAIAGG